MQSNVTWRTDRAWSSIGGELFEELLAKHECEVWGVGIGVPGPVNFVSGRATAPPIMPGWDGRI